MQGVTSPEESIRMVGDVLCIVEQGLRLAALFHDIGHMPFSHDFEHALKLWSAESDTGATIAAPLLEIRTGADKPHEAVGTGLIDLLRQRIITDAVQGTATEASAVTWTFTLATRILRAETEGGTPDPQERVVSWLHRLVAGEVEVDRCDYILRDGRRHGLEFVNYDLERLIDNLDIVSADGAWEVAVRDRGLSALESFLLARFRLYQDAIRHHKVAQVGAALQRSLVDLFESGDAEIREFLDLASRLAERSTDPTLLDRFAERDDSWCLTRLRQHATANSTPWNRMILRRERTVLSLWKRRADFPGTSLGGPGPDAGSLSTWNSRIPTRTNPCLLGR